MQVRTLALAIAALPFAVAAQTSTPAPGSGSLDVWFKSPVNGATVKGSLSGTACYVNGTGVARVEFFVDSTRVNTDTTMANGMQCVLDTTKFSNGAHTLTAVAYNASGASRRDVISVNIQNPTTPPPNTAPTVSVTSPAAGATVAGTISYAANATDNAGVARVEFSLDGNSLASDTAAPYGGSIDTTKLSNGSHTLVARAFDAAGLSASSQVTFNVLNAVTPPPPPTTTTPPPGSGSLDVWFKAPTAGRTVSGTLSGTNCYVAGTGVTRVVFQLDGTTLNTDSSMADGMQCVLDTTKFSNGTHSLTATAYNASGASRKDIISINIQNGTTTPPPPPPPANAAPTASLVTPAVSPVAGTVTLAATASDDKAVARVEFFVNGTLVGSDTSAPYSASYDTTKLANGTHVFRATAYDAEGLSGSSQASVTVQNATTPPPPAALPAGGSAIATFHSIGLYWKPTSTPSATGCLVQFRKQGESAWRQGLNMWYDTRNAECRGSLVTLEPGTAYDVQFGVGSTFTQQLAARTWSENFPVAKVVSVPGGSSQVNITESGSASGYVVYDGGGQTIDVRNAQAFNISVDASYVIVRNFILKGAQQDGIRIQPGRHDVVIEANDISGWGRYRTTTSYGWQVGLDMEAGIGARCGSTPNIERIVIQRNRIHDPRYGANSWDGNNHPAGPNGVLFSNCGGNNVIRYNEFYAADERHYFMDAIGGEDNFSYQGFPGNDSDVYGNRIQHAWDDAIESEGGNRNVRIWGNYIDSTTTGVATTATATGPIYIFRNVYNRSRHFSQVPTDQDGRNKFAKSGSNGQYGGGRRYVFHNTLLQATVAGSQYPLGAGIGITQAGSTQPLTNTVTRNNIFHVWKSTWESVGQGSGSGNDADYDLFNGSVTISGAERNGILGTPIYAPGHGWQNEAGGNYQLDSRSPGFDRGVRLPNFNDAFGGAGPDIGAHEAGSAPMKFGVNQ